MKAIQTSIPDLLILEPKVFGDDRGIKDCHCEARRAVAIQLQSGNPEGRFQW